MKGRPHGAVWGRLNGLIRRGFLKLPSVQRQSLLLNEFPKSGASWLGMMLAELLGMDFPRNRFPTVAARQIFHGHYLPGPSVSRMRRILQWRDGRDVIVSLYYHSLFYNDRDNAPLVNRTRRRVPFTDYSDIRGNLAPFIDFVAAGRSRPVFNWEQFVLAWVGDCQAVHVKYEHLFDSPFQELLRILAQLGTEVDDNRLRQVIERHSIERAKSGVADRKRSKGNVPFVRRGGHGGWRNVFTHETARVFHERMGAGLLALDYETDGFWVDRVAGPPYDEPIDASAVASDEGSGRVLRF